MSSETSDSRPASSRSTAASSIAPSPGLLWVTVNIMTRTPSISPALVDAWYDEHLTDVLSCPGNGGLAIRYKNTNSSISAYGDPDFGSRYSNPDGSEDAIGKMGWVYLALVKLSDTAWLTSKQFEEIPRTSKQLPLEADGSVGSAFSCWHAGLRSYETIHKAVGPSKQEGRAKWVVSLQTAEMTDEISQQLGKTYGEDEKCRSWIAYKLVEGLLVYQEPGKLSQGMVLFEFDGEEAPSVVETDVKVVREDVWELTLERGDESLEL